MKILILLLLPFICPAQRDNFVDTSTLYGQVNSKNLSFKKLLIIKHELIIVVEGKVSEFITLTVTNSKDEKLSINRYKIVKGLNTIKQYFPSPPGNYNFKINEEK